MPGPMNIGHAAKASGVSARMIRHYEGVGLLSEAARSGAGYRQYSDRDVHTLRFIRQSRELGFSIEQIRELLALWQNRHRPSRQVKALAEAHLQELDRRLRELQAMRSSLEHLMRCCSGDDRPDCPILDTLAGEPGATGSADGAVAAARGAPTRSRRPAPGRIA